MISSSLIRKRGLAETLPYNWIAVFAIMFISPLLALPLILVGVYRQKRSAFVLFSFFLGLLAWLQVPLADLFRHTLLFYGMGKRSLMDVMYTEINPDFISNLSKWVLYHAGLSFQWYRLFWTAESFLILTIAIYGMMEQSTREYSREEAFKRFILLWLFFEFIQSVSGARYGYACYNYIFALYMLFNCRNWVAAIFFMLVALKMHLSLSMLVPMNFAIFFLSRKRSYIFILAALGFALMTILLPIYAEDLLGRRSEWYFSDGNVSGSENQSTLAGYILFVVPRFFTLPFVWLAYKYFDLKQYWSRILMGWFAILLMFISNDALVFRIGLIMAGIGPLVLIQIEQSHKIRNDVINQLVCWGILYTMFNTVNYRNIILNSHFDRIVTPIPMILEYQYDKAWLIKNVQGNTMKHERQIFN